MTFKKGQIGWCKGLKHTAEEKEQIRIAIQNKWDNDEEFRKIHKSGTEKQKITIKETYNNNPELRKKLSDSHKGLEPWNKGKKNIYSDELIQRKSDNMKARWINNKEYIEHMNTTILPKARKCQSHRISSIEVLMAQELTKREISFQQQVMMLNKYKTDFLIEDFIIIECDGDYWHNLEFIKKKDNIRDAIFKESGFVLFRFWEHEIKQDVSKCVDKIVEKFPHLII